MPSSVPPEPHHLRPVLHELRLVGFATADVVAYRSQLSVTVVEAVLRDAADAGWVSFRSGRMTGWSLTAAGRAHGQQLLAAELENPQRSVEVRERYHRFLELNPQFLQLCTDWQLRADGRDDAVVNDHADADYDAAVVARLRDLDAAIQPILAELADVLARFRRYGDRLTEARSRVESGELDWFTRPIIDSYHTIWFELHEDLLSTLGLERAGERAGDPDR